MADTDVTFGVSIRQSLALTSDGSFDAAKYAWAVRQAEALGFDHVMVADHVFVPGYMARRIGDFFLDPFTLLSYLAATTSRIDLVMSCLVLPYRQPLTTAKAVASLDQLSGGRVALGVVPGYVREEFEAFGLPLDRRGQMCDEFLRIMKALWTDDTASFAGDFYAFDAVDLRPRCSSRPHVPIWVGGSSTNALRRVAEHGDAWIPLGFTVVDDAYRDEHADELIGRALPTSGTTPTRLRRDLARIRAFADERSRSVEDLDVIVYVGPPVDESGQPLKDAAAKVARGGEEIIDWLATYVDAGATGFVVSPPGETLEECATSLQMFAMNVVPRIRGGNT